MFVVILSVCVCLSVSFSFSLSVLAVIFTGLVSFIGSEDDESGDVNWSCQTCKAPVKSSPPTNPTFYRPDAVPVSQPTVSRHWREKYHIPRSCSPQAYLITLGSAAMSLVSRLTPLPQACSLFCCCMLNVQLTAAKLRLLFCRICGTVLCSTNELRQLYKKTWVK